MEPGVVLGLLDGRTVGGVHLEEGADEQFCGGGDVAPDAGSGKGGDELG